MSGLDRMKTQSTGTEGQANNRHAVIQRINGFADEQLLKGVCKPLIPRFLKLLIRCSQRANGLPASIAVNDNRAGKDVMPATPLSLESRPQNSDKSQSNGKEIEQSAQHDL